MWKEEGLVGFSYWGEAPALLRMSNGNLVKPRERKAQKLYVKPKVQNIKHYIKP